MEEAAATPREGRQGGQAQVARPQFVARVEVAERQLAAVAGRPLYDVTNEAINNYLSTAKAGPRKAKK